MTRDEAIKKWEHTRDAKQMIDFFIEAGMLKVDEEITVEAKLMQLFGGKTIYGHNDLIGKLQIAGLKIVKA